MVGFYHSGISEIMLFRICISPMKQPHFFLAGILALVACTPKEKVTKLETENDSLRLALQSSEQMLYTMQEVGNLIDSIDASRNALHVHLVEGTTVESYTDRLEEINEYVKRSQGKIEQLEIALRDAHNESSAYQMMIMALKDELAIATNEILQLEQRVHEMTLDNNKLTSTVKLQQASLEDAELQLEAKHNEAQMLTIHIETLTDKLKITEAESYFAQAKSLELAANRTKLAPRKKRETYKQALDLYKKALAAGKAEAKKDIVRLEKLV